MTETPAPDFSLVTLAEQLGITYRRVDYYVRLGYLHCSNPSPGSGSGKHHTRLLDEHEIDVLRLMIRLIDVGFMPEPAALLARRMVFDQSLTTTLPGGVTITLTEEEPFRGEGDNDSSTQDQDLQGAGQEES